MRFGSFDEDKHNDVISDRGRQEDVSLAAIIERLLFVSLQGNAVADAIQHIQQTSIHLLFWRFSIQPATVLEDLHKTIP